jgi:hypothetical protein
MPPAAPSKEPKARDIGKTFDVVFGALILAFTLLGVLRLTGVVGSAVTEAATLVSTLGLMIFLAVLGGAAATQGVLVILLVGALGLTLAWAPEVATEEFYSATAQVIPVLLVVLAIEVRLFRVPRVPVPKRRHGESWPSHQYRRFETTPTAIPTTAVMFVTVLSLISGELQALDALASGHPERAHPQTVYAAVAVGLIVVGFLALFGRIEPAVSGEADDGRA